MQMCVGGAGRAEPFPNELQTRNTRSVFGAPRGVIPKIHALIRGARLRPDTISLFLGVLSGVTAGEAFASHGPRDGDLCCSRRSRLKRSLSASVVS